MQIYLDLNSLENLQCDLTVLNHILVFACACETFFSYGYRHWKPERYGTVSQM